MVNPKEEMEAQYPKGTRVQLTKMDDFHAPPIGTFGTVRGVDDLGDLLVNWDNGSTLNVVYGEDTVRKIWVDPRREEKRE
jgi:hypothetical protein